MTLVLGGSEILPRHKSAFSSAHPTSQTTALRPAPRRGHIPAAIEIAIDGQRDSR
jgi:hypothetical protein